MNIKNHHTTDDLIDRLHTVTDAELRRRILAIVMLRTGLGYERTSLIVERGETWLRRLLKQYNEAGLSPWESCDAARTTACTPSGMR